MEVDSLMPEARAEATMHPSPRRGLMLVFVSGLFAGAGIWLRGEGHVWLGWITVAFFGIGVVAGGLLLIPGANALRLTAEGFETRFLWSVHRERWSDVARFATFDRSVGSGRLTRIFPADTGVGYEYVEGYAGPTKGRDMVRRLTGLDGMLLDTHGLAADDLLRVMNAWHARHGRPTPSE